MNLRRIARSEAVGNADGMMMVAPMVPRIGAGNCAGHAVQRSGDGDSDAGGVAHNVCP